ncbi:MAG TPA: hypothetical protein VMZ53_01615 [Kofleriaceae bacterium]|nr:hypothetical protein [Kofleriaceae bacterium]
MRWVLLALVFVVGCKKKEEAPAEEPLTGPPPTGHSVTKVGEEGSAGGSATAPAGSGSTTATAGSSTTASPAGPVDAGTADASRFGGNGKPPYRDDTGHIHGPGGPIFMGRGPDCTDKIDHCLRDGVWFAVGTIRPGSIYRATPAFEFEGKWWDFRETEVECEQLFKTRVAKPEDLIPGNELIWLVEEHQDFQWLNSEGDALVSSRWEAGVIEAGPAGSDKFRVKGWQWAVRVDSARAIIEKKKCPGAS